MIGLKQSNVNYIVFTLLYSLHIHLYVALKIDNMNYSKLVFAQHRRFQSDSTRRLLFHLKSDIRLMLLI